MRLRRRAMGRPGLWRGVLAVAPRDSARICCANLGHGPCAGCLGRLAGAGEALRWLGSVFSEWQNPSNVTLPNLAAQLRALPTSYATALRAVRTYVFLVAGTVSVPPLDVCQLLQRALSQQHHKCINSGAK